MRNKIIKTKITASIGMKIETTDITTEVPVSIVDTMGFANPPVAAVEANRAVLELPAIAAAVPPPAIIANDQVTTGLKSATVLIITAVPAIAAKGTATVSKRLSIYGM